MGERRAILYAFWASSCSWRVRAALAWKGLSYDEHPVDIAKENEHLTDQFRAINPSQKVPALAIDGETLVESMAIIQYIEDTRPEPSLTPKTPLEKARMREICETVVSGIQPLQNVGLRQHMTSEQQYLQFCRNNTVRGLESPEEQLTRSAGRYCVGDQLTQADLCLVPQIYNAVTRHSVDITKYPTVARLYRTLLNEKIFMDTHPRTIKAQL